MTAIIGDGQNLHSVHVPSMIARPPGTVSALEEAARRFDQSLERLSEALETGRQRMRELEQWQPSQGGPRQRGARAEAPSAIPTDAERQSIVDRMMQRSRSRSRPRRRRTESDQP